PMPTERSSNEAGTGPDIEQAPTHTDRHRHVRVMPEHAATRTNSPQAEGDHPSPMQTRPEISVSTHKIKPDLRHEEMVKGAHPGDRYIRYGRNVGPFRRKSGGILAASLETEIPRSGVGRYFNRVKRVLIGRPISTEH